MRLPKTKRGKVVLSALVVAQIVSSVLAWRDLAERLDDEVRGRKNLWGNAGRKPPEPSAKHSDIDEWFGRLMPGLQLIVTELDESIRAAVPGLHYVVKYKRAFYGLPEVGWIIEIAPYDVSVNVVFFGGADFDPAAPGQYRPDPLRQDHQPG